MDILERIVFCTSSFKYLYSRSIFIIISWDINTKSAVTSERYILVNISNL